MLDGRNGLTLTGNLSQLTKFTKKNGPYGPFFYQFNIKVLTSLSE